MQLPSESRSFAELEPAMGLDLALAEAHRCLACHDAPCTRACPTHIDVPAFIKKIATGNRRGAARTILEANILGASCARVCPTEVLCEGACVLGGEGARAIAIGRLQRHATDWVIAKRERLFAPALKRGRRVAVVGAGPAGLACAAELARLGYDVTVFEAAPRPGGLNVHGIAEYKMTASTALAEIAWVAELGVEIRCGVRVGPGGDVTLGELEKRHDAVFLGVGLGRGRDLEIPGEMLGGVRDALDFIRELKIDRGGALTRAGKRVVVVGGGNTAIDAATQAVRLGADEVTLVYRKSRAEMPAYDHEVERARRDGVKLVFCAQPARVVGRDRVEGLECLRVSRDERGRYLPVPGATPTIAADTVLKATGQSPRTDLLKAVVGLRVDERGRPRHDPLTMQTHNPRYFVGGDAASGGAEVVHAVAEGKRAARGIHRWREGDHNHG